LGFRELDSWYDRWAKDTPKVTPHVHGIGWVDGPSGGSGARLFVTYKFYTDRDWTLVSPCRWSDRPFAVGGRPSVKPTVSSMKSDFSTVFYMRFECV
jgi:hypothetical protein